MVYVSRICVNVIIRLAEREDFSIDPIIASPIPLCITLFPNVC